MVIKTDLCSYSENRIYPGRGRRFAEKNGKVHIFISHKVSSLFHQRIKPVKLTWTLGWRRFNKKGKVEEQNRKRTRKTHRVQKAIVGMTLEDIKRRRAEKPSDRDAQKELAMKEINARKQKKIQEKKASKKPAAASKKNEPKPAKGGKAAKGKKH